ncbi:MAG: hypothetical protein KBE01_00315 [Synergistaceae bacterium]|nr:hypothetical protein [Synergistaceae bacterium]
MSEINIVMGSIDYTVAPIAVRELFSFTQSAAANAYAKIKENPLISGAVIVSTCNRTEIYLSLENKSTVNAFELLCTLAGVDYEEYQYAGRTISGKGVLFYLCELASGVKSQIWGEDQILTQVKGALSEARELNACDSYLEVLFRTAITCAKKVKTEIRLNPRENAENSIVDKTLKIIAADTAIRTVMVIGNGKIGCDVATSLVRKGYRTIITLRSYRSGVNIAIEGVHTIDYANRYEALLDCDAVVSATLSPHYTLTLEGVRRCEKRPSLWIDLAVPRDIEPEIGAIDGASLYDVDTICADEIKENHIKQRGQVHEVIEKYICDYDHWCAHKRRVVYA